ncbi:hypothetical protein AeMF1_006918, partial [Aphanomyces euteiches]
MSGYEPIDGASVPSRMSSWPLKALATTVLVGLGVTLVNQPYQTVVSSIDKLEATSLASDATANPIDAILATMTVEEKVAQMVQVAIFSVLDGANPDPRVALNKTRVRQYAKLGVGSFFGMNMGAVWTPEEWKALISDIETIYAEESAIPMIYGIDTTHGAGFVHGATLFPQPLAGASSFNLDLIYRMGEIEAKDSLAVGLPWIFSPILGLVMQPKWSRNYETFGEDPYLASQMGASVIRGIQAKNDVAACMKHFIGYSNPTAGNDRSDSVINDYELVNYYAPPFLAAVKEGKVWTAMETYTSVNGEPVLASKKLLSDLIRYDMGFDGLLVTDADEVNRLIDEHHIANDEKDALYMVFNQTSLDMNMILTVETLDNANGANLGVLADLVKGKEGHANAIKTTVELVNEGLLTEDRLDESVRRILQLKYDLGLFNKSKTAYVPPTPIGSPEDQRDAKAMADESIILLKNEPVTISGNAKPKQVLPIEDAGASIFLTGPLADSKAYLCGGWSLFWQGTDNSSMFKHGVSIRDGLSKSFANVDFATGVDVNGKAIEDRATVLAKAAKSEYTIVVIGEHGYAEKTGDIDNLDLAEGQLDYVRQLTALNSTKVILVIVSGRTRLLNGVTKGAAAVLLSFLPCEQGGEAFADVISGRVNPSAKLPLTYPKNSGNTHLPYYHRVNTACRDEFAECEMEWKFGSGLSYTTFEYGQVTLSQENVTSSGSVTVSVPVTNTGA